MAETIGYTPPEIEDNQTSFLLEKGGPGLELIGNGLPTIIATTHRTNFDTQAATLALYPHFADQDFRFPHSSAHFQMPLQRTGIQILRWLKKGHLLVPVDHTLEKPTKSGEPTPEHGQTMRYRNPPDSRRASPSPLRRTGSKDLSYGT